MFRLFACIVRALLAHVNEVDNNFLQGRHVYLLTHVSVLVKSILQSRVKFNVDDVHQKKKEKDKAYLGEASFPQLDTQLNKAHHQLLEGDLPGSHTLVCDRFMKRFKRHLLLADRDEFCIER